MGPGSPALLLLLLLLPWWTGPGAPGFPGNVPGEPVTPQWVLDGQPWLKVTLEEQVLLGLIKLNISHHDVLPAPRQTGVLEPPLQRVFLLAQVSRLDVGLLALSAEGQDLLLELEKNQLLAPGYTETHYRPDGTPVMLVPNHTDHYHYRGNVRGFRDSWVVLSTCSGMSGLITLSRNVSYCLHPWLPGDPEDFSTHKIFRIEPLLTWKGTCGNKDAGDRRGMASPHGLESRVRREARSSPRYLELYVVADSTLFRIQHQNLSHTKQRLLEIVNCVDQILRTLDIRVVLTGLEVWTEQDRSLVTRDANATLWAFLRWRRGLLARRPHDSAQLLTGRSFQGTTVGLAPVEGMCSQESSGGVSTDHSELPLGTAATMAHEIGHSLGLSHDLEGCCVEATAEQGGCVMASTTGRPFPRAFSACSRRQLRAFLRKGGGACLSSARDPAPPPRCGDGFLEDSEECDCGPSQKCPEPCCLAHNCSLRAGAQCAHGDCCAHCLLKSAGTLCRPAANECDLPEFCTGTSPHCPPDIYLLDGSPCAKGQGYCQDGACPTLEQQCQQLWGPESEPAPEACFQVLNSVGDARGNCGQDREGHFLPCAQRDAQCGTLHCQGGEPNPLVPHAVPLDSTVGLEGGGLACRGAFVPPEAQLDLPDLGLVQPGTQCGPRMVCQDRRCQNATSQELDGCLTACHNRGVCNSNHNCHCASGWAPPFCDKPGFGGSMDSGPMKPENQDVFLWATLSFLLPLLPGAGLAWCFYRLPGLCHQGLPWGCRSDSMCSGPINGPCSDQPLGDVHVMELGPTVTGEPRSLDPQNSTAAQQPS